MKSLAHSMYIIYVYLFLFVEEGMTNNDPTLSQAANPKNEEILNMLTTINDKLLQLIHKPTDCDDVRAMGKSEDGVYTIYPQRKDEPHNVYCQFEKDRSWTVLLRRMKQDEQLSFNKNWIHYRNGFGDPAAEYWIGNENIYNLLQQKDYTLKVEVTLEDDTPLWGSWGSFSLLSESERYEIEAWHFNKTSTLPNVFKKAFLYQSGSEFSVDHINKDHVFECKPDEFKCKKDNVCIPISRKCDQISDCYDLSDEDGKICDSYCKKEEKCPGGNCVRFFQKCNDVKDCTDARDEDDCEDRCSLSIHFLCSNGKCLNDREKCNKKYDCVDHSDEIDQCNKEFRKYESDGTGGYWFQDTNLINPTDEYGSPYFTVMDQDRGSSKLQSVTYKIAPLNL